MEASPSRGGDRVITFGNASRWYGQVIGLNDVTCTIPVGITALLGQNGAGKSTMMRMIMGQIKPTTGEVLVDGEPPFANPEIFRSLGYCPDIDNFYENMTGRQFVTHLGRLTGFSAVEAKKRAGDAIERVGMADRCDKPIQGYSKGMRQRIKLAQAILHDPKIILLDEPLNGLDPIGRREFMDMLHQLGNEGKTIVVSSHILFEVEQMTRHIILLHRGRLLADGDLRQIRDLIDKHPHRISVVTTDPRKAAAAFASLPMTVSLSIEAHGVELETREPDQFYDLLPNLVLDQGIEIESISSPDNNLEAVFRYLVDN
ncbi:MAG: ABC transporter ATP-binding protein [Armatimonadetes bacterium]|nr:ABC transporter ATP-binding protein [Armatimonadota bacterium]